MFSLVPHDIKTPSKFIVPPSGYPPDRKSCSKHDNCFCYVLIFCFVVLIFNFHFCFSDPVSRSLNKKYCHSNSKLLDSDEHNVKTPLSDSNNHVEKSVSFGVQAPASNDIIMLDAENRCVPDSVSPSPRPSLSRLASLKVFFYAFFIIFILFSLI